MSDHDDNGMVSGSGYSTPIPELDDHRDDHRDDRRLPSPHREGHPRRRGTLDSLFGERRQHHGGDSSRSGQPDAPLIRVRDFVDEEVVIDDEEDNPPVARRQRRGTIDTVADSRGSSPSPPNSVKAFAMLRRPTAASFSETRPDNADLQRTISNLTSRHSIRSKSRTARESDAASLKSNRSAAEDDVCFPQENRGGGIALYIDYEELEDFMREQRERRHNGSRRSSNAREFPNLRAQTTETGRVQLATADGDIIEMPSGSSINEEKVKRAPTPAPTPAQRPPTNRFQFFSTSWDQTVHSQDLEGLIFPGEDIRSLFTVPDDGEASVWWLNVHCPTQEEVEVICKAFGIHPLTIEDIVSHEAREKIELFKTYYFANFRSYTAVYDEDGDREFKPFNMFVIVFREGIISFSHTLNQHADAVRTRINNLKVYIDLSADWICYAIIDNIVDSFAPAITEVQNASDHLDDEVYRIRSDDEHNFLPKLGQHRKNIMGLMRLLGGKADVLKGFTKRCNENYQVTPRTEVGLYLGDIQDHVVTMMNTLGHLERMLSRAHSNYLAQLSIDSIVQGTRANKVLSKITFLASIIVPLNVVTGLFGMNVPVPFGLDSGPLAPFFVIVGCLIAFSMMCVLIARKMRYI